MNYIETVKSWPSDAVVEAIQGKVVKVYDYRTGVGKEGKGTVQNAEFQDGKGDKIKVSVWDHPDLTPLEGKEIVLHSSRGGNNKFGGVAVKHGSYVAKKDGLNHKTGDRVATIELSVSRLGQFHTVELYGQNNSNSGVSSPTPAPDPQPASNGLKTQGNGLKPIHGASVGMGINQACTYLISKGEELDPKKVYQIASGLVKVAQHMESGHLYEPKEDKTEDVPY